MNPAFDMLFVLNAGVDDVGNAFYGETSNDEYIQMREDIDSHFDAMFDFNTLQGIESIPEKTYRYRDVILGEISYILRMRAGIHATNKRMDLSIACLKKAQAIMPISGIDWAGRDYMRLVEYLIRDGQFNAAREEWDRLKKVGLFITRKDLREEIRMASFERTLAYCKERKTDLIRMWEHGYTCEECSKYQGRVFSISGQDKRFPRLPEQVFKYGGIHEGCRHSFASFEEKYSLWDKPISPIEYSNRPFVDYRTPEQIEMYEKEMAEKRFEYTEEWFEHAKEMALEHKRYNLICELLPDIAPKSFSGYRRMKSNQTKNYIKLIAAAKEHGIDVE